MYRSIIKNSEGWWWPKYDGKGDLNHPISCWQGTIGYKDLPQKVATHVTEKKVLVQAGGNCGYFVKQYAELFATVYTFEPDCLNFYCLNLNVTEPNVYKYQACLGNNHELVGTTRWEDNVGAVHVSGGGRTPTLMIDDLSLDRCDLIHLDIEGYELNALKGGIETIKKFKPVIALEVAGWARRYGYSEDDLVSFLTELGYEYDSIEYEDKIYKYKG